MFWCVTEGPCFPSPGPPRAGAQEHWNSSREIGGPICSKTFRLLSLPVLCVTRVRVRIPPSRPTALTTHHYTPLIPYIIWLHLPALEMFWLPNWGIHQPVPVNQPFFCIHFPLITLWHGCYSRLTHLVWLTVVLRLWGDGWLSPVLWYWLIHCGKLELPVCSGHCFF